MKKHTDVIHYITKKHFIQIEKLIFPEILFHEEFYKRDIRDKTLILKDNKIEKRPIKIGILKYSVRYF